MTEGRGPIYIQVIGGPAADKKRLESSLTIGTENTDVVIDHPHLSPLHCTLFNRSGIISAIDHNSDYGITINGKRIAPNKMIILMEGDQVTCGELEIKFFNEPTQTGSLHLNLDLPDGERNEDTVIIQRSTQGDILSVNALDSQSNDESVEITKTQVVPEGFIPPGMQKMELTSTSIPQPNKQTMDELDENTQVWEQVNTSETKQKIELDLEDGPTPAFEQTKTMAPVFLPSHQDQASKKNPPQNIIKIDTEELNQSTPTAKHQTNPGNKAGQEIESKPDMEVSKQSIKLGNKIAQEKTKNSYPSQKLFKPKHRSLPTLMDWDSITIPVRMSAFIIDVILSIRFVQFLIQENMIEEIKIVQDISFFGIDFFLEQTKINFDPSYAFDVLGPYVATFLLIRVCSGLIFGVSIGQLLCGVRSEGNILLKRLFSMFRETLGVFTGPFLIFDLPGLFNKKTLKEVLTLSKLYQSSSLSYLLMVIMPPIIFGVCYLGPMLDGEEHFHPLSMDLKTEVVALRPGTTIADELAPRRIAVQFLQTHFPVGNQERTIAFTINKSNQENKTRPFPGVKVLYLNPSVIFSWQKTKNINLANILAKAVNPKNGWIERKFPELKKFVNGEKYNKQEFITEFKTISQDAFSLEWKTLPFALLQYGPFYVGLLHFREAFFSEEGMNGAVTDFKILQIQDEFVLQMANNLGAPLIGKLNVQWLTLATGNNSSLFKIDVRSEKSINWTEEQSQLKEKFLSLIKIDNPQKLQIAQQTYPTNRMFTMGEIIDFFAQGQKRIIDQSILFPRIAEHLKKVAEKLISQKNIFLTEEYKKEIEKLMEWMKDLSAGNSDPQVTSSFNQFSLDLQNIMTMIDSSHAQTAVQLPETNTNTPSP